MASLRPPLAPPSCSGNNTRYENMRLLTNLTSVELAREIFLNFPIANRENILRRWGEREGRPIRLVDCLSGTGSATRANNDCAGVLNSEMSATERKDFLACCYKMLYHVDRTVTSRRFTSANTDAPFHFHETE